MAGPLWMMIIELVKAAWQSLMRQRVTAHSDHAQHESDEPGWTNLPSGLNWKKHLSEQDSGVLLPYLWETNESGLSLPWAEHIDNTVEGHWCWQFRPTQKLTLCFELKSDLIQIKLGPKLGPKLESKY